jgi:hypothetical protein
MTPLGRVNFDPGAFILTHLEKVPYMRFHPNYLSSSLYSFRGNGFQRLYF